MNRVIRALTRSGRSVMFAALCAAAFGLSCGPGGGGSAPKKADLFVSSFTHTVGAGNIVNWRVEVTNLGNKDALDFLKEERKIDAKDGEVEAWAGLIQALFGSAEFRYLVDRN